MFSDTKTNAQVIKEKRTHWISPEFKFDPLKDTIKKERREPERWLRRRVNLFLQREDLGLIPALIPWWFTAVSAPVQGIWCTLLTSAQSMCIHAGKPPTHKIKNTSNKYHFKRQLNDCWAWSHMLVIPALRGLRPEDLSKFKSNSTHIMRLHASEDKLK